MGTITGTQILAIARSVANMDTTRWLDADVLPLLNEALRDLVVVYPQANPVTSIASFVAGTRQTISGMALTRGMQFIDFVRNFDAAGTTPGLAIRRVVGGRKWLDQYRPNWHNDTATTSVRHFLTDEEDPTVAWVWPPSDGTSKAQVIFSALALPFSALGDVIPIDDRYANPLGYLLLGRMYQRNEPGTLSDARAQESRNTALQLLGVSGALVKRLDRSMDEAA
jgi:hypothetical protein